jgi:hypothetical protein
LRPKLCEINSRLLLPLSLQCSCVAGTMQTAHHSLQVRPDQTTVPIVHTDLESVGPKLEANVLVGAQAVA